MSVECFVTGGSGFVGQHLLAALTAQGHKTWVLMRSPGNIERLKEQVGQLGATRSISMPLKAISARRGLASAKQTKNASLRPLYFSISRRHFPGG